MSKKIQILDKLQNVNNLSVVNYADGDLSVATTGFIVSNESGDVTISSTDGSSWSSTVNVPVTSVNGMVGDVTVDTNLIVVDSELSVTSTNPVENKAVSSAIEGLNTLVGDTPVSSQISSAIVNKSDADHTHDEYVNQNAFSNVVVGATTISASSETDTLNLEAGSNITIAPDSENSKIIIESTDTNTTYSLSKSGSTITLTGSDGSLTSVTDTDTTYSIVTQSVDGLMSSNDKTKLDNIEDGANKIVVDSALSPTSTNPVQNKVINTAIADLNELIGDTPVAQQITDVINSACVLTIDITDAEAGTANLINADSLGGVLASEYALKTYVDEVITSGGEDGGGASIDDTTPSSTTTYSSQKIESVVNGLKSDYATPEMYGAAGDGETDDTQAVQSAIDSGRNVLLTGRYKVGDVKLSPFVTITGTPNGRIIDGKICMCPHSSLVGVVFEVTMNNANNCIVDIGTYDAVGVGDSGGDNRYTLRDIKVVTDYNVKSGLDFVYVHAGDGELAHLFGIRITNVSIDGRIGKVFHFKAFLNEGNIVDNGNGVWVNTVSIDNVWCGVPEYLVYIDYADPDGLKAQLGTPLRIGEVRLSHVTGEYSAYAKNDVYIGFPSTISAMDVGFVDKGYTQDGGDPATAMYNIVQQPWYNSAKTIIRTDCMDERFFAYTKLANQNIVYINGSYTVDEATLYETFLHDLSNNAYGLISSRTIDAPVDLKNMTLNLIKNMDDSRTLMGIGLSHQMVFRKNAEDGGDKFSLYFRSRPAVEYGDRVGCLYSDLYMPYAMSKAQLGDAYVPVIGSMVFNTITNKPMWYTGETWVYADGTNADFS